MTRPDEASGGGRKGAAIASASVVVLSVVVLLAVGTGTGSALVTDGDGGPVGVSVADADSTTNHAVEALQGADVGLSSSDSYVEAVGETEENEEEAEAEEAEEEAEEESEEERVPTLLGDWWGLDVDADEGPFLGLVQLGTVVLVVGAGGYAASKRYSIVPVQYRRRTLQVHEWMMLTGTALVAPHFLFAEELEGLGLFVGLLLGVEVASGFYGRHLQRRVIRLSRGDETPALVGRVLETTNERVFSRWRQIHVTLVSITALALLVHILSEAL